MKKWMLFGLIVVAIAATVYFLFFREKTTWQKVDDNKPQVEVIKGLQTCPVCGYQAMKDDGTICLNCGKTISTQKAMEEGVSTNDLLMLEQLDYFSRDTVNLIVDLFGPKVTDKGYPKDPNWKPHPNVDAGQVNEFLRIRVDELPAVKKELADTTKNQ
ncbi:MAG: hypothetical protein KDC92_06065 [Bacteroidetes bacterium]|nr:hypothetical protein [Bacteroidota bacterium]